MMAWSKAPKAGDGPEGKGPGAACRVRPPPVNSGAVDMVIKIARWPALFIVVSLALAFLYRQD
jgi:hypothetical protein